MDNDLLLVDVGDYLSTLQTFFSYGFHPNGLPDSGCASIHALKLVQTYILLAGRLLGRTRVAVGMNHKRMAFAVAHGLCYVYRETGASTKVTSCQLAINVDFRVIVYGTKIQPDVLPLPSLGNADVTLVPNMIDEISIAYS